MISYELEGPKTLEQKSTKDGSDVYQQYDALVRSYLKDFTESRPYIRCGTTEITEGWIIHLSVGRPQLFELFEIVMPVLVSTRVSFKIPAGLHEALAIIDGAWSYSDLGKIICVFPASDKEAADLAQALISLTKNIRGPHIPTDYHLDAVVYTRYGAYENGPVIAERGRNAYLINGSDGNMIPDTQKVPFQYPTGATWPFDMIKRFAPVKPPILICGKFRNIKTLKYDAKGNVMKVLYFKNLFNVKTCVLKQGRRNLMMDNWGRDIVDRLQWQYDLLKNLPKEIPTARALEFISEKDSVYLSIENVEGESLETHLMRHLAGSAWVGLKPLSKSKILQTLLRLLEIINNLHQAGIVHRDLSPGNFIVNKTGYIVLIDLELAYSVIKNVPEPPFMLGTPGFISPQQMGLTKPTYSDDIYGLGALMITFFTGIVPTKFDRNTSDVLKTQLMHFIGVDDITKMIVACLETEPTLRPSLRQIISCCSLALTDIEKEGQVLRMDHRMSVRSTVSETIQRAINGLAHDPMAEQDGLWLSKLHGEGSAVLNRQAAQFVQTGLFNGVAGVMYVLAKAKNQNYDISFCKDHYNRGGSYLFEQFQIKPPIDNFGLSSGYSGFAIALHAGLQAGLMREIDWTRQLVCGCFSSIPVGYDLMNGKAGFGLALIECKEIIGQEIYNAISAQVVQDILAGQDKKGSWSISESAFSNPGLASIGFITGNSGILHFLLKYFEISGDERVRTAIIRGLNYILSKSTPKDKTYNWYGGRARKRLNPWLEFGLAGITKVFIQAYSLLGIARHKEVAESYLLTNPEYIAANTLSYARGLSGVGAVYLEGYQTFGDREWMRRAEWIADFFTHSSITNTDGISTYWFSDESDVTCSSWLYGNTAIIDYLIRYNGFKNGEVGPAFL